MYVILDTEYHDEIQMCTSVIGYFKSHEDAEKFLYNDEYVYSPDDSHEIFGYETKYYIKENEFEYTNYVATIEKLELIEVN